MMTTIMAELLLTKSFFPSTQVREDPAPKDIQDSFEEDHLIKGKEVYADKYKLWF